MTPAMQIALTATPLAAYFYALGVFHSGRSPRMVAGPVDVALLAFGLGGLVAFGPFGRAVLGRVVGVDVGWVAWSIWVGVVILWAFVLSGSAMLKVTVYHVSPEDLEQAVREALGKLEGRFVDTLNGYEDPKRGAGLRVKSIRLLRSGSVEAYGQSPGGADPRAEAPAQSRARRAPSASLGRLAHDVRPGLPHDAGARLRLLPGESPSEGSAPGLHAVDSLVVIRNPHPSADRLETIPVGRVPSSVSEDAPRLHHRRRSRCVFADARRHPTGIEIW